MNEIDTLRGAVAELVSVVYDLARIVERPPEVGGVVIVRQVVARARAVAALLNPALPEQANE